MDKKLKIGIIGYGRIGKIHLENSIHHSRVGKISVCDPKQHDIPSEISFYNNYKDLIESEKPDGVIICSPTPTHLEMIKYCCNQSIHIFCEKPVDLNIEKIANVQQKVNHSNIMLQVGFNRRFDPDFSLLKDRISNGELGDIYQVSLFSRDPGLPSMDYIASSGGMMMDMTIHDFDMCRFITDSEVAEVYTKGHVRVDERLKKYNDIDTATVVLTMKNNVTCTIQNSRSSVYGYDQRIEVFGSKGMMSVDNNNEHRLSSWTKEGKQNAPPLNFFLERYADSYKIEMDSFFQSLILRSKVAVSLADALEATRIAKASNESMDKGRVIQMTQD